MKEVFLPSGRAVRYRTLTPSQIDTVSLSAAKLVGAGATLAEYQTQKEVFGIDMMLVEVSATKLDALPDDAGYEAALDAVQWQTFEPGADRSGYDKLFDAKDHELLKWIYASENTASRGDVNSVMGKARTTKAKK